MFGRKPAVPPRYPFLRRFLLERCANREQAERLLARRDLHDAERALIRWGKESLIALREQFPDLTREQEERAAAQRAELESHEVADGLPTAFSLWSPLVEWSLDMKRREVHCTFEAYAVDPSTSKLDFARKRLETATLRL
jgi:hypothetical protein